jgi:putative transposon-encoded protein
MAIADENSDAVEENPFHNKVKFKIYGEELIEKIVNSSGNSGRVYLPPEWIGTKVKVIRCHKGPLFP